jgi:hypothetical protein
MFSLLNLLHHFQQVLFQSDADLNAIALFRITLGIVLFVESLSMIKVAPAFFSSEGIAPPSVSNALKWGKRLSVFRTFHSAKSVRLVFLTLAAAALMLALGIATFVAAPVCWLLMVSRKNRNPLVSSQGDSVATLMLTYLVFTDSAARLSLDSVFGLPRTGFTAYWLQFLMQFQVCMVYVHAVISKLYNPGWISGTVVYHVLSDTLMRNRWPKTPSIIKTRWGAAAASWGTIFTQGFFPVGVCIVELRPLAIIAVAMMHISMQLFLSIKAFQPYMIANLCLFLTTVESEKIAALISDLLSKS